MAAQGEGISRIAARFDSSWQEASLSIFWRVLSAFGVNHRMRPRLEWLGSDSFRIGALQFHCSIGSYDRRTVEGRIILLKPKAFIHAYIELLERLQAKNVLEFGVWQGGSALFMAAMGKLDRLVGIDIEEPLPDLEKILASDPVGRSIGLHFKTSQDDTKAVRSIVEREFGSTPLDIIVDDASHFYAETRASLEATFGYLRPGGIYIIEDWGWAHWPDWQAPSHPWREREALSNLVFELAMAVGSKSKQIAKVEILSGAMVVITRGHGLEHGERMDLSSQITARGRLPSRI